MIAWTLFYHTVALPWHGQLWLIVPLCASVAIVYKTVRTPDLRRLPQEVLGVLAYVLFGLALLGLTIWAVHEFWP